MVYESAAVDEPIANLAVTPPPPAVLGTPMTASLTLTSGNHFACAVDFQDGSEMALVDRCGLASGPTSFDLSYTFASAGEFNVSLNCTNKDHSALFSVLFSVQPTTTTTTTSTTSTTTTPAIAYAAVSGVTFNGPAVAEVGTVANIAVAVNEGNHYSCLVRYCDGTNETIDMSHVESGSSSFSLSHAFASVGHYTISLFFTNGPHTTENSTALIVEERLTETPTVTLAQDANVYATLTEIPISLFVPGGSVTKVIWQLGNGETKQKDIPTDPASSTCDIVAQVSTRINISDTLNYATDGVFELTAEVSGHLSRIVSNSLEIRLQNIIGGDFAVTSSSPVFLGEPLTLSLKYTGTAERFATNASGVWTRGTFGNSSAIQLGTCPSPPCTWTSQLTIEDIGVHSGFSLHLENQVSSKTLVLPQVEVVMPFTDVELRLFSERTPGELVSGTSSTPPSFPSQTPIVFDLSSYKTYDDSFNGTPSRFIFHFSNDPQPLVSPFAIEKRVFPVGTGYTAHASIVYGGGMLNSSSVAFNVQPAMRGMVVEDVGGTAAVGYPKIVRIQLVEPLSWSSEKGCLLLDSGEVGSAERWTLVAEKPHYCRAHIEYTKLSPSPPPAHVTPGVSEKSFDLAHTYGALGTYQITAHQWNDVSWTSESVRIPVTAALCARPAVRIVGATTDPALPQRRRLTFRYVAEATVSIDCSVAYSVSERWTLRKVTAAGLPVEDFAPPQLDYGKRRLVVPKLTLKKAHYELRFEVEVVTETAGARFIAHAVNYVEMYAPPIPLIMTKPPDGDPEFKLGMVEVKWKEPLALAPGDFSFDPMLGPGTNIAFQSMTYFCRRLRDESEAATGEVFPVVPWEYGGFIKDRANASAPRDPVGSGGGCFGDGPGRIAFEGPEVMLDTNRMLPGTYQIVTDIQLAANVIRNGSMVVKVSDKAGTVIKLRFGCDKPYLCPPTPWGIETNRDSKVIFRAVCEPFCHHRLDLKLSWTLHRFAAGDEERLIPLPQPLPAPPGSTAGNESTRFALYKEIFETAEARDETHFALRVAISSPVGYFGSAYAFLEANRAPGGGWCSIAPLQQASDRPFRVACQGWDDNLTNPDSYEIFAESSNDASLSLLTSFVAPNVSLLLAPGTHVVKARIVDATASERIVQLGTIKSLPGSFDLASVRAGLEGCVRDKDEVGLTSLVGAFAGNAALRGSFVHMDCAYSVQGFGGVVINVTGEVMVDFEDPGDCVETAEAIDCVESLETCFNDSLRAEMEAKDMLVAALSDGLNVTLLGEVSVVASALGQVFATHASISLNTIETGGAVLVRSSRVYGELAAEASAEESGAVAGRLLLALGRFTDALNHTLLFRERLLDGEAEALIDLSRRTAIANEEISELVLRLNTKELVMNEKTDRRLDSAHMAIHRMRGEALSNVELEGSDFTVRFPPGGLCTLLGDTECSLNISRQEVDVKIAHFSGNNYQYVGNETGSGNTGVKVFDARSGAEIPVAQSRLPIHFHQRRKSELRKPATLEYKGVATRHNVMRTHYFEPPPQPGGVLFVSVVASSPTSALTAFVKHGATPGPLYYDQNHPVPSKGEAPLVLKFTANSTTGVGIGELAPAETATSTRVQGLVNGTQVTRHFHLNMSSDYTMLNYTAACYFYAAAEDDWDTDGCSVGPDTTEEVTHCECHHLTSFASGLFVAPNAIDFDYVLKNLNPLENPSIYAVLGVTIFCFVVLLLLARRWDKDDILKLGVTPLPDNRPMAKYFYLLRIRTGAWREAGTKSRVNFVLSGDGGDTTIREVGDAKRPVLQRGQTNDFVMAVDKPLGELEYLRVWHDSSGRGPFASWFLCDVLVTDLQTRQRFAFVANRWLCPNRGDGLTERVIPVSSERERGDFQHLFTGTTRKELSDSHIWLSVFARPASSRFTRVQRVACCLCIVYTSMLASAMWYGTVPEQSAHGSLRLGPLEITPETLGVAIMSNLLVFPINFLIAILFRKAGQKKPRAQVVASELERELSVGGEGRGSILKPRLTEAAKKTSAWPHWLRYVAWALWWLAMVSCAVFILFYGIQFGEEKSRKWISSILIGFCSSILLTQPIKIILLAIFCSCVCKNRLLSDEDEDADEEFYLLPHDQDYLHFVSNNPPAELEKDQESLDKATEKRLREVRVFDVLRELLVTAIFATVVVVVSYGSRDVTGQHYNANLRKFWTQDGHYPMHFGDVRTQDDFWAFMSETFLWKLREGGDNVTKLISPIALRQVRSTKESCTLEERMKPWRAGCLAFEEDEEGSFGPRWDASANASDAFVYRDWRQLKGIPYIGVMKTYTPGGYLATLQGSQEDMAKLLSELRSSRWLDRWSRLVEVELSGFNVHANYFVAGRLVFEFPLSGSVLTAARFDPFRLYRYEGGFGNMLFVAEVIFFLFIVVFCFKELRKMKNIGFRLHFGDPWTWLEGLIVLLAISTMGVYVKLRVDLDSMAETIEEAMERDGAMTRLNLEYTQSWDEVLVCLLAFELFLTTVKLCRLFRFNPRILMLIETVRAVAGPLSGFYLVLGILFMAFTSVFYLLLHPVQYDFATYIRTLEVSFALMLGMLGKGVKFSVFDHGSHLAAIFFIAFSVCTVIICLNIVATILNELFARMRLNAATLDAADFQLFGFVLGRVRQGLGRHPGGAVDAVHVYKGWGKLLQTVPTQLSHRSGLYLDRVGAVAANGSWQNVVGGRHKSAKGGRPIIAS